MVTMVENQGIVTLVNLINKMNLITILTIIVCVLFAIALILNHLDVHEDLVGWIVICGSISGIVLLLLINQIKN